MEKNNEFELIITIVNSGFTDLVMDSAKEKGAKGGTIFTARGTGNPKLEEFFGIEIHPEKEIVLIVVPSEIKDDVLLNIYKNVGLSTKGNGIAFSLKIEDVIGITPLEEIIEKSQEN